MFASQLTSAINHDRHMSTVYRGSFARDELPKPDLSKNSAYIVNSSKSTEKGSHWFLICLYPRAKRAVFFDSLAEPPSKYGPEITKWLKSTGLSIECNTKRIQGFGSVYCGLFVLFALYYLSRGYALKRMIKTFSGKNYSANDQKVALFVWVKFKFNARQILLTL